MMRGVTACAPTALALLGRHTAVTSKPAQAELLAYSRADSSMYACSTRVDSAIDLAADKCHFMHILIHH